MKAKKKLLIFSSLLSVTVPLIAVIACGSSKEEIVYSRSNVSAQSAYYFKKYYRPFQFNELKELGKGQPKMWNGIGYDSYGHGMSFVINVIRKIGFNLYDEKEEKKVKYYNNWKEKFAEEKKPKSESNEKKVQWEKPEKMWKFLKKGEKKQYEEKLIRQAAFFSFDPLGIDNFAGRWTLTYAGQKYYYFWTKKDKSYIEYNKGELKLSYSMPSYFTIIDGDRPKPEEASIKEGSRTIGIVQVSNYDSFNDSWLSKLNSKILSDAKNDRKRWDFNYKFVSPKQFIQGFQIIKNPKKMEEIKTLITAVIKNLNYFFSKKKNLNIITNSVLVRLFNYIRDLDFNDKVLKEIDKAIEELNNGSHNMFAVEVFARGIENVPLRYLPDGNIKNFKRAISKDMKKAKKGNLIGMANTIDSTDILRWTHHTKKGYEDENGKKAEKDREGLDPDKWKIITSNKRSWQAAKRLGREIKVMGAIVEKVEYQKWAIKYNKWVKEEFQNDKPLLKFKEGEKRFLF